MSKIVQIQEQLSKSQARVAKLETAYAELRLQALKQVEMTKNGETITLTYGDRVLKAKKNPRYNRFNVFEGGKKIVSEYLYSIHDLRFDIAQGRV
jgi:hypothetical protein